MKKLSLTMAIAKIVPIIRLPRDLDYFDYAIPPEMNETCLPGTFVAIPFRSTCIAGLVWNVSSDTADERCKSITQVLPLCYPEWKLQQSLFEWFARHHCISKATGIKTLLPAFPKTFLSKGTLRKRTQLNQPCHTLVTTRSYEAYHTAIRRGFEKNKRTIIFFSTIHECELFEPHAVNAFGRDRVLLLHGSLPPTTLFARWMSLFDDTPRCILATRTGAGIPLHDLGTIIIDAAERMEHNQYDLNPRYDIRALALKIHEEAPCQLVYSSVTPRLEEYRMPSLCAPLSEEHLENLLVVNMKDELRITGRGYISECLNDEITSCLNTKKGVFLFLNRTGTSRMITCKECGYIHSCPTCHDPLYARTSNLFCDRCSFRQPLPDRCPTCRSIRFHFIALGTEKIKELMQKEFPFARVIEITKQTFPADLLESLHTHTASHPLANTIIVGTTFLPLSCPESFSHIGCIGVLSGDPVITSFDFRAEERHVQTLFLLRSLADIGNSKFLLQTFSPRQRHIKALETGNYKLFANELLAEREKHHWPPSTHLIRLRFTSVRQVRLRVPPQRSDLSPSPSSEDPSSSMVRLGATLRSKTSDSLLFSIPQSPAANSEIPDGLHTFLMSLSNDILIDIDPVIV